MEKGETTNLIFSIVSVITLMIALILNYFRTELFGVVKGYAPHNFGFNMTIFMPLSLLSFLTGIVSIIWLINKWRKRQNTGLKKLTLILSIPSFGFLILIAINIIIILRQ